MAEQMALNIPDVTVDEFIQTMVTCYANAIIKGIPFKKIPAPFAWGAPGIGKSDSVRQIAKTIEQKTGKRVSVVDVRLMLFSPIDLRGIPVANADKTLAVWLKPKIFEMDTSDDVVNILFLDELSSAPSSIQAAAYQITLDRTIGEHTLPENCIVIAAGNRLTDQSISYKIPKALANRMLHFNIKCDYSAWREWALKSGVSDKVIAYIGMDNSRLSVTPDSSELAYPTPRSWEFVSTLLKTVDDNPERIHNLIAACIGNDTAIEFEAFCKGLLNMPSVDDILYGRCKEYPKKHDVIYALISAVVAKLRGMSNTLTSQQLENVCAYISRFPRDYIKVFMVDIQHIDGINEKLMKCRNFQSVLNKM